MFIKFGLNSMHKALSDVAPGKVFRDTAEEDLSHAREAIFAVPTKRPDIHVLVYTSYSPGKKESRDYAQDSVKFVLRYRGKTTRYVGNYKRVFRSSKSGDEAAFLEKVKEEVGTILHMAVPVRLCSCGALLVPRYAKGKGEWFMGCMNYPKCPDNGYKKTLEVQKTLKEGKKEGLVPFPK